MPRFVEHRDADDGDALAAFVVGGGEHSRRPGALYLRTSR